MGERNLAKAEMLYDCLDATAVLLAIPVAQGGPLAG